MSEQTFTKENFDKLKQTCQCIVSLCDENVDGQLMAVQLMMLANRIEDFSNNPIVNTSGCIPKEQPTMIVVNSDASARRVEEEYQKVLTKIKSLTNSGYDDFILEVRGTYSEAYDVCDRLKEIGVHICEKGFDHKGFAEYAYANVHFNVPKT